MTISSLRDSAAIGLIGPELSDLAITEPAAFAVLVAQAKTALGYIGDIEPSTHARISA